MFAPTSGTTANLQLISCANGFPAEWRPGWDHGASDCRIDLEGSNMSTRMRISEGKLKRTRARSIFAPPSRQMISGSARRDRPTSFYSSVTLLSRNSGSVAGSFASGTNHGQQVSVKIQIATDNLIHSTGRWWQDARCIGANYSPGVNVWMGWPHAINSSGAISSTGIELIL